MADPSVGWSGSFDLAGWGAADGPIIAAGLDLVDVGKLSVARARWAGRLEARLFSPAERDALGADDALIGVAFGIKESVIKLLGGLPPGAGFHDIQLERTGSGWLVELRGGVARSDRTATETLVAGSVHPDGLPPVVWAAATDPVRVDR
jgi:hypothetical protein